MIAVRLWETNGGLAVLAGTALAIALAVGFYVIRKVRSGNAGEAPGASAMMSNFDELRARGVLSDEEYRTIKAKLAERLRRELNDTGQPG